MADPFCRLRNSHCRVSCKNTTFESVRLTFREICTADSENIVRWRSNTETYIYFRNPKPISLKEHNDWFENSYLKNPARTDFIITERESSTPIGIVGISIVCGTGEISYIIGESAFLRRGFATEAINAIVKQFSNKVTNFSAEIHPKNIASAKTVEKCGFIQARESEFLLYERKGEQ